MKRRTFIQKTITHAGGILIMPKAEKILSVTDFQASTPDSLSVLSKTVELNHFWSFCVGAGRANEGLRASWLEQLATVKKNCGFQYCRFHGLFHDDMFAYRELNGHATYNWQYIDDLFDRMLDIGVRPFVELSFMPKDLASTDKTVFWWKGHIAPPNDFEKWAQLVKAFVTHCRDRYGIAEIRQWFFEVWNEPDLHVFWDGTKSQYFELYKVTSKAVKDVDLQLKVGGPATSNYVPDNRFDGEREDETKQQTWKVKDINQLEWHGVWIKDFLAYCAKEHLFVDFISTHPYPTDYAIDPGLKKGGSRTRAVDATWKDLTWLKKVVQESAFPHAAIHLTEWSSSPSPRDPTHDSLQAAAYIIKVNLDCAGLADSLSYWTFTDVFEEGGAGSSIFHGGFGLINYQGIPKPAYHAYRMLNRLGNELLHKEEGLCITRHSRTKKITVLVYHYPPEMKEAVGGNVEQVLLTGSARSLSLKLRDLAPKAQFSIEQLDADHGFAWKAWQAIGKPEPPTREQTEFLKQKSNQLKLTQHMADDRGNFSIPLVLTPWTCILIDEQ